VAFHLDHGSLGVRFNRKRGFSQGLASRHDESKTRAASAVQETSDLGGEMKSATPVEKDTAHSADAEPVLDPGNDPVLKF